jgi:hypothetical protein
VVKRVNSDVICCEVDHWASLAIGGHCGPALACVVAAVGLRWPFLACVGLQWLPLTIVGHHGPVRACVGLCCDCCGFATCVGRIGPVLAFSGCRGCYNCIPTQPLNSCR